MERRYRVSKSIRSFEITATEFDCSKLVYTISPPSVESGAVTALQPSPALSVVAVARADGSIIIHDVRLDKELIRLSSTLQGSSSITSITFRTDGLGAGEDGRKAGVLATASSQSGDVLLWDLNKGGRMTGILRDAHDPPSSSRSQSPGGISKIEFLPGQLVLVSSGLDNSLKTWIFDESPFSPIPRILHRRGGHAAPVSKLSFLPTESEGADAIGKWLLSASRDQSLWGWSIRRDNQSTELSQGNIRAKAKKLGITSKAIIPNQDITLEDLKAPEITCIACSLNRDGGMGASTGGGPVWANTTSQKIAESNAVNGTSGWESIVTGHKGDSRARTWFWGRKKAGRWAFETGDGAEVRSVAITLCGTFALVGSAAGGIDMYNLQSGIHRKRFPAPVSPAQARKLRLRQLEGEENGTPALREKPGPGEGRHTRAVTSINVDSLNRVVISCGLDGKIKFWDFHTGILQHEIDWYPMSSITGSRYHRPNDLLALSCDDLSIRLVDIETKKLVREFWGCVGSINDFCFSSDGRWMIAASMDSVVRVWDLPTGHLIDAFSLPSPCTSLAFSPTGEFLATSHPDTVGINIWTNRTLFAHVPTRNVPEGEVRRVNMPSASGEGNEGLLDAAFEDEDKVSDESNGLADPLPASTTSPDQLGTDLMTLSLVPRARWQTLLHLDVIAQRNKPIEPPKAPEKAPFFLPTSLALSSNPNTSTPTADSTNHLSAPSETTVGLSERSRILLLQKSRNALRSQFTTLLHQYAQSQDSSPFITHLASLSPSAADIEIRSLSPMPISSDVLADNEMTLFVRALTQRLSQKRDFELVQAWMAVFLKLHGEIIINAPEEEEDGEGQGDEDKEEGKAARGLRKELRAWREVMQGETKRLGEVVDYCIGVIGFLRSGR